MGLLSLIATTPSACTELVDQGIPAHVHAVLQETHPDTRLFLASIAAVCSLACHTSNNASAGLADALANDMFRAAGMAADLREPEQSQLLQYSSVGLLFMMWPTPRALSPVQISNVASMMLYPDVAALPSVQLLFCSLGQVHRPHCDPFAMLCSDKRLTSLAVASGGCNLASRWSVRWGHSSPCCVAHGVPACLRAHGAPHEAAA